MHVHNHIWKDIDYLEPSSDKEVLDRLYIIVIYKNIEKTGQDQLGNNILMLWQSSFWQTVHYCNLYKISLGTFFTLPTDLKIAAFSVWQEFNKKLYVFSIWIFPPPHRFLEIIQIHSPDHSSSKDSFPEKGKIFWEKNNDSWTKKLEIGILQLWKMSKITVLFIS